MNIWAALSFCSISNFLNTPAFHFEVITNASDYISFPEPFLAHRTNFSTRYCDKHTAMKSDAITMRRFSLH